MRSFIPVVPIFTVLLTSAFCVSQQVAPEKPAPPAVISATHPAILVDNNFVQREFGPSCSLLGNAPMTGDLDGDGVEDIVMVAHCKSPFADQAENNFSVIDPYYTFYGYGDPKVNSAFSSEIPELRGIAILIIHGSGADAWRSAKPKAKFLVINMPVKQIALKKMMLKKKAVTAIYTEEAGVDDMTSALFWDGKKYKYMPFGSSME
ncbi:MAG: hypothetical protein JOY93_03535 [Acidobacteriales bacterium]|nr:hypothetical protein [Terriglobales bacterium]